MTLTPDEEMEPLVLPEATGGNGELTYSLTSEPAGTGRAVLRPGEPNALGDADSEWNLGR